ncbi:MAG: DNA-3-methyladenine glycosylase 2 family protein [Puia sp.]|nr:DNA-3-methyladenine glycosylase 2 family protein [Puia sp.]
MEYIAHLSKDRKLKRLIDEQEPFRLRKRRNIHLHLYGSIMSQQLSTRVAEVIHKRFLALYGGRTPTPEKVLATTHSQLRAIGLSGAKAHYVLNVARFALEHGLDHKVLTKMSDEEAIAYLTRIKGVGRWTAEMLLMFSLGREDIFALDDLGVRNAMIKLYKLDDSDKIRLKEDLLRISGKWSSYRTYACLHLWHWKDNSPGK